MTTQTYRIRQMAQEADCLDASGDIFICDADTLSRFAQLVAEDCAKMCAERAALMKMAAEQANNTQPGSVPQQILSAREVEARNCGQDIIGRYSLKG